MIITEATFDEAPEEVECPTELSHIWSWFTQLDATRANSGMGFSAITHQEITAWSEGMRIGITPFERECLVLVDGAFRTYCNSKEAKNG